LGTTIRKPTLVAVRQRSGLVQDFGCLLPPKRSGWNPDRQIDFFSIHAHLIVAGNPTGRAPVSMHALRVLSACFLSKAARPYPAAGRFDSGFTDEVEGGVPQMVLAI